MTRRPTVVLFDIDGTLISTGGAGRRAIERAFHLTHGRADACHAFPFDGQTDRAIARHGLSVIGVEPTAAAIDRVLEVYLEQLSSTLAAIEAERYVVFPGAREAAVACVEAGFAVGLGTGNVERGARAKLERSGLNAVFGFGGFGDDHEARAELLKAGARRGAQRLEVELSAARVLVIGDTPKDIAAAKAIGAQCLAVATGSYSVAQLEAAGATWAVESLVEAIAPLMGG